jgi:hypothetical protein
VQFHAPQQYRATRNPTRAVSGEYLKKKNRLGTFRTLHFQGRRGGVAGWQTARINKGTVLCLPAALSHKEPDPGDFRCISRITDPGSHAERKLLLLLLLLVKMTPPKDLDLDLD